MTDNDNISGSLALAETVRRSGWPNTMDAQAWVAAWMLQLKKTPDMFEDEGLMLVWFGRAIIAGYDTAMLRAKVNDGENKNEL